MLLRLKDFKEHKMEIDHEKSIAYAKVYLKTDEQKKKFTVYYCGWNPYLEEHEWVDMPGDYYCEYEFEFVEIKYNE